MGHVLVTGGAGFIGRHVAAALLNAGHSVICLDDLSSGSMDNVPPGATFAKGSITDRVFVDRLFSRAAISHIAHLAAYAAETMSHAARHYNYSTNLLGSINLINAAVNHDILRLVFVSSVAVYGHGTTADVFSEDDVTAPCDPYGIAKCAVERDLQAARSVFGVDYTIFRPHNVYGEHQSMQQRYRNVVATFMRQALNGEAMTVVGSGEQTRSFTYVGDIAADIATAVDLPQASAKTYNIGSDEAVTIRALAEHVADALNVPCRIRHIATRLEAFHARACHDRWRRDFGDRELTSLRVGLERTAEWVLRQPPAPEPPRGQHIEVSRWAVGLPQL